MQAGGERSFIEPILKSWGARRECPGVTAFGTNAKSSNGRP